MRPALSVVLLVGTALLSVACAPAVTYSPASARTYPKKAGDCFLEVYSTAPQRRYDELGTFDIHVGGGSRKIESTGALREAIGPDACELGADALIAFTYNGLSLYTRAVAIRWTARAAPAAPAAPTPTTEAAPATETAPAASK
jgi:hypothetical protein